MHVHPFDPFFSTSSPIHDLDARIKLIQTILFILCVALAPLRAWATLILLYATILSLTILSHIGLVRLLKRSGIAIPFVLAALPLAFTTPGHVIATLPLGSWSLSLTQDGVFRVIALAMKSWISVQAAILLSATTPFPDLLLAMRSFRVPRILVSIIGLMWRYLFLLADEAIRMMHARDARSGASAGQHAGGSLLWRARVTGGMAGALLVRGLDRADRIYSAMLARGFDGETRALPVPRLTPLDYGVLAAGISWIAICLLFGTLFQ
jgi:cobalt/nickel transport system permease protein